NVFGAHTDVANLDPVDTVRAVRDVVLDGAWRSTPHYRTEIAKAIYAPILRNDPRLGALVSRWHILRVRLRAIARRRGISNLYRVAHHRHASPIFLRCPSTFALNASTSRSSSGSGRA